MKDKFEARAEELSWDLFCLVESTAPASWDTMKAHRLIAAALRAVHAEAIEEASQLAKQTPEYRLDAVYLDILALKLKSDMTG